MKTAVIICTRLHSRRVPNKAILDINGRTVLEHAYNRLKGLDIDIIYAVPDEDFETYWDIVKKFNNDRVSVFAGFPNDPLARMHAAAENAGVDNIIRVTHDKIFLDEKDIYLGLKHFNEKRLDYLYSTTFTDGTAFEIISKNALRDAAKKFKNVEYISYAVKAVTNNCLDLDMYHKYQDGIRLLIDFPEDVELMNTVFGCLGNDCTQQEVFEFLLENPWTRKINAMPKLTVYTCAYNAEKWLDKAIQSVTHQTIFKDIQYILVDDHSNDSTANIMSRYSSIYDNVHYVRNNKNLGLASSSNAALTKAQGPYIIRLDADDFFPSIGALEDMLTEIKERKLDALYPNNYFGDLKVIQKGDEHHHVGGTMFRTRAINYIKFTEGLKGYDSLDVFVRAQNVLKIGYLNRPMFFYTQRPDSMSKTDLEMREKIKEDILNG